jgi:hypothetical protein
VIEMTSTTNTVAAVESIEDYLERLEEALEPEGDFWENELLGQMSRVWHLGSVNSEDADDVIHAGVAKEIEEQLRGLDFWRDDLSIRIDDTDFECFEIQNDGRTLTGTLYAEFTVVHDGDGLWSARSNIFCERDLPDALLETGGVALSHGDLDALGNLPDSEVDGWWLARGLSVWGITAFDCRWVDIGEVELADDICESSCFKLIGAADLRAKRRFRQDIQMETGRYLPLESIRAVWIPANAEQVAMIRAGMRALLDEHPCEDARLRLLLTYAVSGGRCYVSLNTFSGLDGEQIRAFFEEQLFPWFEELGLSPDEVKPVFVPSRLP